jgi:hypothetical protein
VPDGINWFTLDDRTGVESIFLIASLDPLPDLESALKKTTGRQASSQSTADLNRSIDRIERETGSEAAGNIHTRSGVRTRTVLIQSDRRLAPAQFKTSEQAESVKQTIQGIAGAVQRIQFSHLLLPSRSQSHD